MSSRLLIRNSAAWSPLIAVLSLGLAIPTLADSLPLAKSSQRAITLEQSTRQQQLSADQQELDTTPSDQKSAAGTSQVSRDVPVPVPETDVAKKDRENYDENDSKNAVEQEAETLGTPKTIEVGSEKISVKPGSIDDANAVGTRSIGGRGLGDWYSTESEIRMGKMYAADIERSTRLITDPVVFEYVNRIGQNIVKNSDCKVPFTIKLIDSDQINAMALPGGFFFINSGLILSADDEAELAGVMAHEIAHVCAHHAVRQMTRMKYTQLGMVPLIMVTGYGWTSFGIYQAAQFAVPVAFLKFGRDFEEQADYLGIQYAYRAGYDPQSTIAFFEKIQTLEKRKPGVVARVFSDHPQTPDRILHSQEEIERILEARDQYLVTTSEFDDVKGRLARIQNKRRLIEPKEFKPSLRRASAGAESGVQEGYEHEEGPTLHRREDREN